MTALEKSIFMSLSCAFVHSFLVYILIFTHVLVSLINALRVYAEIDCSKKKSVYVYIIYACMQFYHHSCWYFGWLILKWDYWEWFEHRSFKDESMYCLPFWRTWVHSSFCSFSFDHCIACPSLIYSFWLTIWCFQTFLHDLYTVCGQKYWAYKNIPI